MAKEKWDGDRAVDKITKRIVENGDHHRGGERVSSDKAFERAKQIVQEADKRRQSERK